MISFTHSAARGRPAALLALLVAAACGGDAPLKDAAAPAATIPAGDLVYVTNEDSQELSIISTATDSLVATINVGTRPRGLKVSADGRTIFVALSGSPKCPPSMPDEECEKLVADKSKDGIAVVNAATRAVERVLPGGSDPEDFDLSTDGTTLFISNEDAGIASIVDVATGTVKAEVKVGNEPEGVKATPDGSRIWVTGESDHDVTVLETATGKAVGRVVVGQRPRGIGFTPDGRLGFVTAEMSGEVWVVDAATLKPVKTLKLVKDPADSAAGDKKPMGVAVSADGGTVYISTGRGGTVDIIDVATLAVTGSIKAGARPWGVALSRDGSKLYTANGPSNDVTVIDTKARRVIRTVPVGRIPWGVAVGPQPEPR
jgi:YVTN family beta-propeller protein